MVLSALARSKRFSTLKVASRSGIQPPHIGHQSVQRSTRSGQVALRVGPAAEYATHGLSVAANAGQLERPMRSRQSSPSRHGEAVAAANRPFAAVAPFI